jgi:hypothetical protein
VNDYTRAAKKRIFDMLKGKKTQEEYNAEILYQASIPVNVRSFERKVEQTIKRRKIQDEITIKKITDSIYVEEMINYAKGILQEKQLEPDLILMTGFLNMKECIPPLQEKLQEFVTEKTKNNNKQEYGITIKTRDLACMEEQACRFALAKLGDKTQYKYILDTFIPTRYFDKKFLSYFRDDKITWKYIDVNYLPNETIQVLTEGAPMTVYCMDVILPFIKNSPVELHNPFWTSKTEAENYRWAEALHDWLMKNRDSVKFNYDAKEGWFWSY